MTTDGWRAAVCRLIDRVCLTLDAAITWRKWTDLARLRMGTDYVRCGPGSVSEGRFGE